MTRMEQRGLPTVTLVAREFHKAFRNNARVWGQPNLAVAEVPTVIAGQSRERILAMVDATLDALTSALTQPWESPSGITAGESSPTDLLTVEAPDALDLSEAVNRLFLEKGWSDGFPVVPPTRRAVERMLRGTSRAPQEVLGAVEPGFGAATVEKIAVNAVMAGCRPEHMPVLIAAVRAATNPGFFLREMQVSTIPEAPMLLVNGPVRKKLGFNVGTCAMGPGAISYVNSVIGRAFRLMLMNLGECYPGQSDINVMGLATKYGQCVAENEEASPWEPYHVERGYDRNASTVTLFATLGVDTVIELQGHAPEPLLDVVCRMLQYGGSLPSYTTGRAAKVHPITGKAVPTQHSLLLAPDHAQAVADCGWSKQDIKRYVYEHARLPQRLLDVWGLPEGGKPTWGGEGGQKKRAAPSDVEVPLLVSPDALIVAVAGGTGHISQFFWGCYGAVTQAIDE